MRAMAGGFVRGLYGWLALALLATATGCGDVMDGLRSHAPPAGTESARRLEPGPFAVVAQELRFIDESRPTMANGDIAASTQRILPVTVWTPIEAGDRLPLIVYSHGFTGNRREMVYLLEHLAGYGYVVAGLDFPLTHGEAAGGANYLDLASQPGDVRFLIDSLLAEGSDTAFAGRIDPERIGLAGLSYGGLTTTLLTFHPREADRRVKGAVSIAGPAEMFTAGFFSGDAPPFLMIAGTEDAFVPYDGNAENLLAKAPAASLLTIEAGTHLGFVEFASTWMRFSDNPDGTACGAVTDEFEESPDRSGDPFEALGGPEVGIDVASWGVPCQRTEFGRAMRPQQQHWITAVAVRAFFDSLFDEDATARAEARRYLTEVLPAEEVAARFATRLLSPP
jgi:predicted dienelactone hydrolase